MPPRKAEEGLGAREAERLQFLGKEAGGEEGGLEFGCPGSSISALGPRV